MISLIIDGIKTIVGWMGEKSKAKHDKEMARLELEKRLLLSKQEANSQWEIAQLQDKDKILRWAAFLLFASPLIAGMISPELGKRIEAVWSIMPVWKANVISGMCLAVFGIRKVPEFVGSIVASVKNSLTKN